MVRMLLIAVAVVASASSASAEPWYRGKYGRNRLTHMGVTLTLGGAYLASQTVFLPDLAPDQCRWCKPGSIDRSVRDALTWTNTHRANVLSAVTAYVVAPIMGVGILLLSDHDASASRLIDDVVPVLETVAISQIVTQIVKFSIGRQRPYARFGTEEGTSNEDNLSFWSGHSALGFGITTSAGLIAHRRGYWTEPYIWGVGIGLSLATEYLRMAADKHYLSDVLVGGFVGIGAGLLIPRLMTRDMKLVPVANGAAIAGTF